MFRAPIAAFLCLSMLTPPSLEDSSDGKRPDRIIDIVLQHGKLRFIDREKGAKKEVGVVVGQTVRWRNLDRVAHSVRSAKTVDSKRIFESGPIAPGQFKDVLFDINVYERAGGRRAGFVRIWVELNEHPETKVELVLISAARS